MCVNPNGSVDLDGANIDNVWVGVRPALRFNLASLDFQIGEKVRIGGFTWTCISEELLLCDRLITKMPLLLCDRLITKMPFRKDWQAEDANKYEASDVKKFVEKWFAVAKMDGLQQP